MPPTSLPSVPTYQPLAPLRNHNGQHEIVMNYERSSFHGMQTFHGLTPLEPGHPVFPSPSQALQPTALGHAMLADVPQQDKPLLPNPPKASNLLGCAATYHALSGFPDDSNLTETNSANRLRTESARNLFRSLPNGEVRDVVGNFLQSRWLSQNEMEPSIPTSRDALGVVPSISIYILLVYDGPVKRCKLCNYQNERSDRTIAHLRSHFNHRPYACNSSCGSRIWSVSLKKPRYLY